MLFVIVKLFSNHKMYISYSVYTSALSANALIFKMTKVSSNDFFEFEVGVSYFISRCTQLTQKML